MKKVLTLTLVQANSQILLGFKKRGFGAGRWNGFGGKLSGNETIVQAAARELTEECGIVGLDFQACGLLLFRFASGMELEVHVFRVTDYCGEVAETEEMRPQWFYQNEIPFDKMWPDDRFWFPYFLDEKKFLGEFEFLDENQLVDSKVTEVQNL